jgi:hypothetical protein
VIVAAPDAPSSVAIRALADAIVAVDAPRPMPPAPKDRIKAPLAMV